MSVQIELPPRVSVVARHGNMLSESAAIATASSNTSINNNDDGSTSVALRRESLKLSFNRSISEPASAHQGPNPPVLSPPSIAPSLHPSKRCRMESTGAVLRTSTTSSTTVSGSNNYPQHLLRPPPTSPSVRQLQQHTPAGSVSLPASPCSESSTLQRTLLLQHASTIKHEQLVAKLETRSNCSSGGSAGSNHFLLVDCRPFIAYNVNHIRGAINVNCCDRFNRKRLQQGKATLADLATTKEGKELLKKRTWREVVVYDDCSESLELLPTSHTLFLVMNALVEDQREPVMLLGGLRDFQVAHRHLCADSLMRTSVHEQQHQHIHQQQHQHLPALPSPSDLCDTKDIENHPATQVLPYLFLGNMRDAADVGVLRRLGVKFVLNVTAKPPAYAFEPGIVYKQLEAADNGIQNLRQFFEEAFAFIDLARQNDSGVLIHCHAGVSRSPTIAVAYLMKRYPMAMAEAYKFVKTRRSIISPNLNFMGQLWEFEQGLRHEEESGESGEDKEDLTLEMRQVKEAMAAAAAALYDSDKPPVTAAAGVGTNTTAFCWSDQKEEETVTSECSV